jgi:hypothetical protein
MYACLQIRGVFCVCPEDDCNEVEPIALDDCNSSAGSLAKSLLVTLTASAAALSFLML